MISENVLSAHQDCDRIIVGSADCSCLRCFGPGREEIQRESRQGRHSREKGSNCQWNILWKYRLEWERYDTRAARLWFVVFDHEGSKKNSFDLGGTLVSQGVITVGDLTSLLLYTAYVGNGLTMLT